MSKLDFKTSDSLAFCWESTEMQWFILAETRRTNGNSNPCQRQKKRFEGGKKYQGKSLNIKVDDGLSKTTYVNLDWRINAALESFKIKYSGSQDKTVIVFVSIRLESVLRHIAGLSLVP
ncbi:hypothetical protein T4E_5490 [Trichinella pseudospiralis]|uniref:Uncharacterized protein n=1 Tax=Trichinella pseudospiralis TaxID=6337 RepID=A0A0V0XPQ1_TRIPS|nr:hypothetical protein T4E_5490 [Trichinella pseudospiralis]